MATMPVFNNQVKVIINDGDTAYAGGSFTTVNGVTGYLGIAKFNMATGVVDTTWKPSGAPTVASLQLSPDKASIYVAAGTTWGLRKFNVDSNTLQPFVGSSAAASALKMDGNYLYVFTGGSSGLSNVAQSHTQGQLSRPLAFKIDVTANGGWGEIDPSFVVETNTDETFGYVYNPATAVDENYLYLGGSFSKWDNQSNKSIVKINKSNGKVAADWTLGTKLNQPVYAITLATNGSLYATGMFTTYDGANIGPILKVSKAGVRDTNFTCSGFTSGTAYPYVSIEEWGGCLYVGGSYVGGYATVSGSGVLKSTGLDTFVKDTVFQYTTGLGAQNISAYAFNRGANLFLLPFQSTSYKGSGAGYGWVINRFYATQAPMVGTTDLIRPTTTISSPQIGSGTATRSPTVAITISFSESVFGFTAQDLVVTNGTVGGLSGSGLSYSASIVPAGQGVVSISVPQGVAYDGAGNSNTASNVFSYTYDTVSPILAITSSTVASGGSTSANSVAMTFTFSEPVTGFSPSKLSVYNYTVSSFSGSGRDYTMVITPINSGTVSMGFINFGVMDTAGNQASGGVSFYFIKSAPMITSSRVVAHNQLLTTVLNAAALESVAMVPKGSWRRVLAVYTSPGNKTVVTSFLVTPGMISSPGRFLAKISGTATYILAKMIIIKAAGQGTVVQGANLPSVSSMSISVT